MWLSEGGVLEFFIFGSSNSNGNVAPKTQINKLLTVTGFPELPPFNSLGFHYCRWEILSSTFLHKLLD